MKGTSHQLDLPPSKEPSSTNQNQPLFDAARKSLKKSRKHNHSTTQQLKHTVGQQQQNGQQRQNGFYQLDKAQVANG